MSTYKPEERIAMRSAASVTPLLQTFTEILRQATPGETTANGHGDVSRAYDNANSQVNRALNIFSLATEELSCYTRMVHEALKRAKTVLSLIHKSCDGLGPTESKWSTGLSKYDNYTAALDDKALIEAWIDALESAADRLQDTVDTVSMSD